MALPALLAVGGGTTALAAGGAGAGSAAAGGGLFTLANLGTLASAGSFLTGGLGAFQGGNDQQALANQNAETILFNGLANAESIRQVADLQIQVNEGVAGLNAQALVDTANFNANQILQTSRINAFFQWFGAEYDVAVTNYNAQIATNNSELAMTNSALAHEQGLYNSARIRENNQRVIGEQKAGFAKNGVTIDGSAYDVLYDTAIQASRERLLAITSSDLLSYSFQIEAIDHLNEALFLKSQAKAQRLQGYMESAFSLYEGNQQAEAQLFEGYTRANLIMKTTGLESALIGFSSEEDALRVLREAAGLADASEAAGDAASDRGGFGLASGVLGAIGSFF